MLKEQKQCTKCGEGKIISMFAKRKGRPRGTSWCKTCISKYQKQYRQLPEAKEWLKTYQKSGKPKEYHRQWCKRNPDKLKLYALKHKGSRAEYYREYERINKETKRAYRKEYYRRPEIKRRIYTNEQRKRARKLSLPHTLTAQEWQHALNYFNGCCAVCGRQLNDMFGEFKAAMDHWIPLSYKGDDNPGTVATNIVPLCHGVDGCNNSKHNKLPDVWLKHKFSTRKANEIMKRIQDYFDSL